MNKPDHSDRDEAIETLFYTPLKRRRSVSQELFDDHWKDAHGPLCARLPGLYQYIQYHLAHDEGRLWPSTAGVSRDIEDEEQLDGIAVLAFTSIEDREAWVDNGDILMIDEQNAFEETIGYETINGNSTTHIDHRRDPAPNGDDEYESLHVLFRKNEDTPLEEFHEYIAEEFVPSLIESDQLLRLRSHLIEEYDNSIEQPPAPNVSHDAPPAKQYQAALDIAFEDRLALQRFFESSAYTQTEDAQAEYISQIHAFPVRNTYVHNYNGEMTIAGQRGATVARTIRNIGALNQIEEQTIDHFRK